jgi:hypothetical protein
MVSAQLAHRSAQIHSGPTMRVFGLGLLCHELARGRGRVRGEPNIPFLPLDSNALSRSFLVYYCWTLTPSHPFTWLHPACAPSLSLPRLGGAVGYCRRRRRRPTRGAEAFVGLFADDEHPPGIPIPSPSTQTLELFAI